MNRDLKLFKVLQFIQHSGKLFHLSVTLFPNTYFLMMMMMMMMMTWRRRQWW